MHDGKKLSFCPPPTADGNYKYFLLSATEPVRGLYDNSGCIMHAESPDSDYGWVLKFDALRHLSYALTVEKNPNITSAVLDNKMSNGRFAWCA